MPPRCFGIERARLERAPQGTPLLRGQRTAICVPCDAAPPRGAWGGRADARPYCGGGGGSSAALRGRSGSVTYLHVGSLPLAPLMAASDAPALPATQRNPRKKRRSRTGRIYAGTMRVARRRGQALPDPLASRWRQPSCCPRRRGRDEVSPLVWSDRVKPAATSIRAVPFCLSAFPLGALPCSVRQEEESADESGGFDNESPWYSRVARRESSRAAGQ